MASCSTTQTVQSSFSSKPQPENDVFLNFRGEDTRNNFTDHLYRALKGKGIKTFKDDTNLELGHPISPNLLDAIEKSRIAVVILSKNYASSRCCLEELVKILECKEEGGLTVLPIFYHVDPDHVQNQRETFAVAFAEHEYRFGKEQVEIWRKALIDVAELAGKTLTNGPEGEFIQKIVDWIFSELKGKRSIVYEDSFVGIASQQEDGLVGIASRVKKMNSFLDMNSNDVRFIGICGKSGMGKTTLARFVFNKICKQFEACSFLENVKEVSKAHSLETLQEQLLCDISKEALRVRDVSRGIQVIKNVLRDKKVLIVVDDASEKRHLLALAGKSWFGPRSRIIVTTEDECLLKSYEIQTVYRADGLNNDEAQLLFSHKAHCEIDFLDLGYDFVTYAQGSPLVLKVLGSHLCKRTKEEWETAWNRLKEIPNEDIPEKLRIACNGLEELEQKLFLHIACFFKGEDHNRVAAILESVCYSNDKIRKLIDKSLITIEGGKLCMHHLIQQMGWKIVRGESMDLGRRSRLWDCKDVLHVLKENIGTERIEGMVLNLPPDKEQEELKAEPFSNMNKLKLLKICKLHLPCLHNLSNELLLLEWHEYPLKLLPNSFQPLELVELIMHRSGITQLPSEFRNLPKLKLIDLSDSQNLCRTPDFNELPNIERLIFQGCTGLHALDPSVGSLKRLILLNLKDCKCLEDLPHEINLESLKILILSSCSKLKKFPKIGRNMTSMLELYLDRTAIEELPSSIKHLTSLTLLNLRDCKNLSSLPRVICNLISLKILILSGCKGQPQKARYLSGLIPTLSSIGTILTLPYTYLIDRQSQPEPINLLLPESFPGLSSLVSLDLSDCNLLDRALPDDLSYLSSLTYLYLRKNNFTRLPDSISQLLNLKLLFLDHCSKLQSLPYLPLSTQFVSAQGCTSLENYSNQVIVWTSGAARFTFINCHGLTDDEGKVADVPLLSIHFQSLWQRYMEDQILQIKGFCLVLPQIEIPEWFNSKECGPSVRIPLPPNLFNNRSWKGIALCFIFVVPPNLMDVSPGQYFHEFICHFDLDGSLLNCPLVLKVPKETFVGSFGLWLYISHARFTEHFDEVSCISFLIRPKRLDIQVKMCGAHILYEQNMVEFVQNSRQENFRSCDLSRGHENLIEDHMSNSQGPDPRLKRNLKSLLTRLYQVDWAKNHLYDYIFYQIAHPPCWFTRTNLGPSLEMLLPADVHDNSTWLGFTICASYRIQMRAGSCYKLHSTIFLRYSSLSASDEVSFPSYTTFPLSKEVSDVSPQDSGRLVVFYIPRRGFQLKQCDHIGASFESSDPAVQFEMCGIRLLYEQNVPEFVQTLVELGSPDANHQSFSVHLSDQLGMMQYCNHDKENCCAFLPERRLDPATMRMLLPINETIQEECTSRETFSNQVIAAGISKNSSRGSINSGIPFGNGQYGSKMSGHLECWFKPYLQNHYRRRSTFNRCSPQIEIPMWFTNKINGSSVRIRLHSNFYHNPDWIGFAISAVFSSHKNPTTTRSRFSHMAICHLKTNLGCMNPLLYCGVREEHVLTLLHQRIFLWESIISHMLLSPKFSECTWVEFSFVSDSLDVSVRKCAVDLVFQCNLKDFTLTMAPCITSCDDPFTSNESLPFYHRDKFSGSDGLYGNQTNGTSVQYSYGGQHPHIQLFQTAALDFNPSTLYNCCFPPSKIQDWFSHQNHGCSATMDLPSNLYHNSNWMGLVLYASFSIQGGSNFILSNLNSGKSHTLYCQCQMSMANVDDQTIAFSTSKEEIMWLLGLGEFIWISYIPGEPFKNMLQHYSRIEASFVSDWSGVIVQNCALQLLYQHDQVQFEQELKHCNNLISENHELILKLVVLNMPFILLKEPVLKQNFVSVTYVDLSTCNMITKIPDLSMTPNIRTLRLRWCSNLVEIDDSVGRLDKLREWDLEGCRKLETLPKCLTMKSLSSFHLIGCKRIKKFPNILHKMEGIKYLHLPGNCTNELPPSFGNLIGLKGLYISSNSGEAHLSGSIYNLQHIMELDFYGNVIFPKNVEIDRQPMCNSLGCSSNCVFPMLKQLRFFGCTICSEIEFILNYCCPLTLEELVINSSKVVTLPESMSRFERLHDLLIHYCNEFQEIRRLPHSIRRVEVAHCHSLDLQSFFQLLLEIMGLPPNLPPCLGETSYMLMSQLLLLHSPPMLICFLDVLCEYSFEVTGDENDIPNWFNHQRDGNLISFSIGPEFPTIALCIAFGIQDSHCNFFYHVIISINGSERMFGRNFIEKDMTFGHLSFSCRSQSSLQELFWDLQLTDQNHVEILCETFHNSQEIAPIIKMIGVHVECNCPPQNPSIFQDINRHLSLQSGEVPSSPVIKKSKEISETEDRGECEDETDADIETTLKTKVITPEQDESNEEDPSPSTSSVEKCLLTLTQGARESSLSTSQDPVECSSPMSQTPNSRNEAYVLTNTWSNQDGVQDLSFESIKVSEISELMDLPTRVHSLKIEGCDDLEFIPKGVMSSELSLQDLYIINCCSLKSFPKDHPPTALKILYIRNCKKLNFPLTTEKKTHQDALLEYLCIGSSCDSLKSISLDLFPNLKSLSIWDCANLELLSMPVQKNLTSLEALEIRDCPNLVSFLGGGLRTMNLTSVWLSNCKKLEKLPELHTLDSLQSMFINNCPELVSLSEKGLPSRLSLLSITFCNKLKLKDEWGLDGLAYLHRLEIEGGCVDVGSLPEKFLPSNLSSLRISGLLNLKNLDNKGFQQLTALQRLEISRCPNLQSLPEDGFPSSLSFLCIKECPLLTSKFRNKKGKDWSKIDHISCIEIDEEVIS